jgi:hypothetical protein
MTLQNTVYALDATNTDLRLSLFDLAPFRQGLQDQRHHLRSGDCVERAFFLPCSSVGTLALAQTTVAN